MTVKFDNVEAIGDCALSDVRGMVGNSQVGPD